MIAKKIQMVSNWQVLRTVPFWKKPFHIAKQNLASFWLKFFLKVEIIGITGSVGKTTTKEAIACVLGENFRVLKTEANIDPIFNIPKTILKLRPGVEKLVLEMGVEYPGEMDFYLTMARPRIGVITQIAWTHTEFLGDIQGVAKEKGKLLESLPPEGWAVLNWDDLPTRKLAAKTKAKIFYYGTDAKNCHLVASGLQMRGNGLIFALCQPENLTSKVLINFKLIGRHNVYPALAAAAVGIISGMELTKIKNGLEKLEPCPGRLNVLPGPQGSVIIDDSYNASPAGVLAALETLKEYPGKRKIAVLGQMCELGDYTRLGHQLVGKKVAQLGIDHLFTLGDRTRYIAEAAQKTGLPKENIFQVKDFSEASWQLKKIITTGDVVLVKGSRATHLEKIVCELTSLP